MSDTTKETPKESSPYAVQRPEPTSKLAYVAGGTAIGAAIGVALRGLIGIVFKSHKPAAEYLDAGIQGGLMGSIAGLARGYLKDAGGVIKAQQEVITNQRNLIENKDKTLAAFAEKEVMGSEWRDKLGEEGRSEGASRAK